METCPLKHLIKKVTKFPQREMRTRQEVGAEWGYSGGSRAVKFANSGPRLVAVVKEVDLGVT